MKTNHTPNHPTGPHPDSSASVLPSAPSPQLATPPAPKPPPSPRAHAKPRSDAILLNLPPGQQALLAQWLLDGLSYADASARLQDQFGVHLSSLSTLSDFWRQVGAPLLQARRRNLAQCAATRAAAAKEPADFDAAILDALRQHAFDLISAPHPSLADYHAAAFLLARVRRLELAQHHFDLAQVRLDLQSQRLELTQTRAALPDLPSHLPFPLRPLPPPDPSR